MRFENIRQATIADSEEILRIYSYYIKETAYTFEIEVPSLENFTQRIDKISSFYPFLLYIEGGKTLGFAYANLFKERAAYCYDVEATIYLDKDCLGKNIGTKLYSALLELVKEQGFYNVYSGITFPNKRSEKLHEKLGFEKTGVFKNCGYKFNTWHSVQYFQKCIKSYDVKPSEIKSVKEIDF